MLDPPLILLREICRDNNVTSHVKINTHLFSHLDSIRRNDAYSINLPVLPKLVRYPERDFKPQGTVRYELNIRQFGHSTTGESIKALWYTAIEKTVLMNL